MSSDPYTRYGTHQPPPPPLGRRQVLLLLGFGLVGCGWWLPAWHQVGLASILFTFVLTGVIGYSFVRHQLLSWPPAYETAGQVTLAVLMYLPHLTPLLFLPFPVLQTPWHIAFGVALGLLILLPKSRELWNIFSVVDLLPPLGGKGFGLGNLQLFESAIVEEIFFRFGLLSLLFPIFGWFSIIVSTGMFLLAHWANRWAPAAYSWRDYLGLTVLSLVLGCVFLWLHDPWICVIAHLIYNTPALLLNTLKFRRGLFIVQATQR